MIGEYDEIEIPPVKPYVIRHRRFACRCGHCGVEAKAPAPAVATTTPFGPRIHALAIYLKGFQALSYERLRGLFGDAFGLSVSEGALMNMFIRSHSRFEIEAEKAKAIVRAAKVVASDETGVRIEGTNSYHWVFHCKDAVVHQPDYSRAARIVDEMMDGHVPEVWISDRYSAQQNHGERHQTCLAHLARDTAFAFEHGSDDLPFRFKLWLGKAFDLARTIADFAASRLARKKRELEKQLETLLAAPTGCDLARELQAKIGRARDQLLTFCDYPGEVDVTNNDRVPGRGVADGLTTTIPAWAGLVRSPWLAIRRWDHRSRRPWFPASCNGRAGRPIRRSVPAGSPRPDGRLRRHWGRCRRLRSGV